jgi:hypothetical protein
MEVQGVEIRGCVPSTSTQSMPQMGEVLRHSQFEEQMEQIESFAPHDRHSQMNPNPHLLYHTEQNECSMQRYFGDIK